VDDELGRTENPAKEPVVDSPCFNNNADGFTGIFAILYLFSL
jgi:hypothetical protein